MWKWSLLLLIVAGIACRKNKTSTYQPVIYPEYHYSGITHFGGFRLFTSSGEILNATLVEQYAAEFQQFFYQPGSAYNDPTLKKFAMVSEDSVWNLSTVPVGEAGRRSTGDYDRFTGTQWTPVNDTNDLVLHLMKYPLYLRDATPLGFHFLKAFTPSYVLKHTGDTLFFPINRFVQVSRSMGTTSFYSDRFNNVLEVEGMSRLRPGDTLLVQNFDLFMVKRR